MTQDVHPGELAQRLTALEARLAAVEARLAAVEQQGRSSVAPALCTVCGGPPHGPCMTVSCPYALKVTCYQLQEPIR
jgi:hypothetical protein